MPKKAPQRPATPGSWKKGQSGNPGGRPSKVPEISVTCREMTPAVVARLARIIKDGADRDAVPASKIVLAYAWGAPKEDVTIGDGSRLEVTVRYESAAHDGDA